MSTAPMKAVYNYPYLRQFNWFGLEFNWVSKCLLTQTSGYEKWLIDAAVWIDLLPLNYTSTQLCSYKSLYVPQQMKRVKCTLYDI